MSAQPHPEVDVPAAASTRRVTAEEYLRTSYRPDLELIDGELKEKAMPTRLHGLVQIMIGHWFALHRKEWKITPQSEVRTQVRPGNFRLPDIAVTRLEKITSKTQDDPPILAIEILSDDDRFSDLGKRARDLSLMGVGSIWLIDPEQRTASVWSAKGAWEPTAELRVSGSPVHLDLPWLWEQVDMTDEQI